MVGHLRLPKNFSPINASIVGAHSSHTPIWSNCRIPLGRYRSDWLSLTSSEPFRLIAELSLTPRFAWMLLQDKERDPSYGRWTKGTWWSFYEFNPSRSFSLNAYGFTRTPNKAAWTCLHWNIQFICKNRRRLIHDLCPHLCFSPHRIGFFASDAKEERCVNHPRTPLHIRLRYFCCLCLSCSCCSCHFPQL